MTIDDTENPFENISDTSKVAQELQKGFFLNDLLGPVARVIGSRWADRLTTYYSQKDRETLERHLEKAKPLLPPPEDVVVTPGLIGSLIEWAEGARKIDPIEDSEISKAWYHALKGIFEGETALLSLLKNIPASALIAFINGGKISAEAYETLVSFGLTTKWRQEMSFFYVQSTKGKYLYELLGGKHEPLGVTYYPDGQPTRL